MSRIRSIRGTARLVSATAGPAAPPQPKRLRGLGDVVAIVAEPIARAIHLDKSKCGCAKRQDRLNKLFPFHAVYSSDHRGG